MRNSAHGLSRHHPEERATGLARSPGSTTARLCCGVAGHRSELRAMRFGKRRGLWHWSGLRKPRQARGMGMRRIWRSAIVTFGLFAMSLAMAEAGPAVPGWVAYSNGTVM